MLKWYYQSFYVLWWLTSESHVLTWPAAIAHILVLLSICSCSCIYSHTFPSPCCETDCQAGSIYRPHYSISISITCKATRADRFSNSGEKNSRAKAQSRFWDKAVPRLLTADKSSFPFLLDISLAGSSYCLHPKGHGQNIKKLTIKSKPCWVTWM